jgi:asparaginyl-tRNA synthetase
VRKQKDLVFINIQSENSLETDQIITSRKDIPRDVLRRITHGASLHCCGEYVSAPMQARKDFMASSVEVLGECSPESYPFKNNVRHSLEYLRQFTHLRTRSKLFAAIMRVRSAATLHILNHFTTQGYTLIHTPILTSCDCEGAGEVFSAETREEGNEKFFNTPVNLTVSGQLHAEAAAAGLKRVFTFGPTFRSDKSHTRRHLAEFYMLEAEVCFTQDLDDVISPVSTLYRDLSRTLLNTCHKDIEFIHTSVGSREYVVNSSSSNYFLLYYYHFLLYYYHFLLQHWLYALHFCLLFISHRTT